MAKVFWNKKVKIDDKLMSELDYLIERVEKDKVHPIDIVPELKEKYGHERSVASLGKKLSDYGISYGDCTPEARKLKTKKQAKAAVVKDVEKARLKQRLSELESKYKVLTGEQSLGDRMVEVLLKNAKVLPKVKLAWTLPEEKVSKEIAVLGLGDFHLGENVDKEVVCGFGEYNFEIFVSRLKFLSESIKSITIKKLRGYQIKKLVIFGMGDMISGRIHEELIENAEDIMFQIINGAYVTAQFVLEMAQMFPEIEIVGVLGNHGRLTKKKYFKKRYVNWDFVFYQFLSIFLAGNEQIKCDFPKSYFVVKKIYGWNFLILHGDNIRSWMGIPWYGIERAMHKLGDLLQSKGVNIHYRVLGHFHNTGELDRVPGEIIINGSVIGGNEYSLMAMSAFERPTQLFFGVHKEIGVTWRYPLRLDLKERMKGIKPYKWNRELQAGEYMKELLGKEKR